MAAKKSDKEAKDQDIIICPMHNSAEKKLAVPGDLKRSAPDERSTVFTQSNQGLMDIGIRKKLSLLLIPGALVIIALLFSLNIPTAFEPPLVLPLMNTLFLGIIPIVIAYVTFKVYTKNGSASVLLIGSGILIFGLGSIAAGWLNPLPGGPNMTVTIHNTCACIGSILIFAGAVMSHTPAKSGRATGNTGTIAAAFTAIVVFVTIFSLATLQGMIPPFFVPGSGPTVLRQVILENAIALFSLSSVLFMVAYRKGRTDFFFWYSVALALIAIGLLAVFVQPSVGSLIGWTGRSAQYLGFVFALYGVLIARKAATAKGVPLEDVIGNFFVDAEQNYQQLVETATDAIVTIDEDYRVLLWNSAAERMFGYPRDDAKGASFLQLVIDDQYIAVIKNDELDISSRNMPALAPELVEIVGKRKGGALFPVELTVSRRWQEGKLIQTCILRDITERKRADEELLQKNEELAATGKELKTQFDALTESERITRLSEERLIMAQEIGRTGSWEYNVQTGKIWGSAEWFHIYGFPQVAGDFPLDVIEACIPERERVHQALTDLITKGEEYNIECAINPADGSVQKIIHSIARLEKDEQGNPLRVVGVIHDITNIWQIKALRESEEKLSRILNDITDVVWSLSWPDMKVYYISPSAEKLYGRPVQEFIDKPSLWAEITHPDDKQISEKALEQLRKEGSALIECRIVRPDGTIVWIHDKSKFIFDEHDMPIRVDGISSDITERKQVERALAESGQRTLFALESADMGTWELDLVKHKAWRSLRHDQIFGYAELLPEWTYERFIDHILVEDRLIVDTKFKQALENFTNWDFECRIHRKDGEVRWIWAKGQPEYNDLHEPVKMFGIVLDITERKRDEEILWESEARFRKILEMAPLPVCYVNVNGVITFRNERFVQIFGYTADDVPTLTEWWQQAYPDAHYRQEVTTKWDAAVKRATEDGIDIKPIEYTVTCKSGEERIIEISGITLGEDFLATFIDLTDSKRAEEALRESEEKYRALFAAESDGIFVIDKETGIIIDCNDAITPMYGYRKDEVIGQPNTVVSAEPDATRAATQEVEGLIPIRYHKRKNGSIFAVEITASVVLVKERNVIVAAVRDISGRKVIQDALQVSELHYRRLFETAQDGILILDEETGVIIDANTFLIDMLGYPLEYFVGKLLWELGFIKDKTLAQHAFTELKTNGYIRYEDLPLETIDGRSIDVEFISNVYPVNSHKIIQCNIRDITARKRAEDALALASKKLTLLSGITRHDINNQLTVQMGYISILEKKEPDTTHNEYLQKVSTAAKRISAMIQFTKEYEKIGVHAPIWQDNRTLVDTAAKEAALGKVEVKNDLPSGTEVFADPLVVKVFYNLMDNAVRYGGKITTIRFSAEETDDDHLIICEDDGDGIVAAEKEKIFERGFGKNTGLGLALSREILDITGITITETGEPGKGARFEMTVPKGAWRMAGKRD